MKKTETNGWAIHATQTLEWRSGYYLWCLFKHVRSSMAAIFIPYYGNKQRLSKWEQAKATFSELNIARESATIAWHLDSKAGRGVEMLYSEKKWGFQYAQIGDYWYGKTGGRLTRSGASYKIELRSIFIFFWVVLCWKKGQKQQSWQSLTKSWPLWADCCRGCEWESNCLAIVSLHVQSLSIKITEVSFPRVNSVFLSYAGTSALKE